ncbi:hypothetical protein UFOVP777_17 [uncultured Caudovirales phage]|uniref:Uncharacterized protein n=1 Tax=uncultured Caudovirales phage TaxID=2100421 RepID=A0A6J5P3E7_9CAUD|nr:hypothetical protein UFOVP777_17 [uncultured Caudovirales phage]
MKTRPLKQGHTPAECALLYQVTAANASPPVVGTNEAHAEFGPLASCDLLWEETAGGTMDLEVYYMYRSSGLFVRDDTIGKISVNANSKGGVVLTPSSADAVYVSVTNFAAAGEISVWAQAKYA